MPLLCFSTVAALYPDSRPAQALVKFVRSGNSGEDHSTCLKCANAGGKVGGCERERGTDGGGPWKYNGYGDRHHMWDGTPCEDDLSSAARGRDPHYEPEDSEQDDGK